MTVRTTVLAGGTSGAAGAVKFIYTCPSGRTAIVKDMRFAKSSGVDMLLNVVISSGAGEAALINRTVVSTELTFFLQPYVVLRPGDRLYIFSQTSAGWRYWLSGSELEGVAPA